MNIVMPMAGRGSRFREIGIDVPKPLIEVRGRPMYAWAMDSLPLGLAKRIIFICQDDHLAESGLEAEIEQRYAEHDVDILSLDHITEGQVCTVLVAKELINNSEPLLIYNADTYCRTNLEKTLPSLSPDVAGLLGVFQAPGDKWSFARLDADGRVVETAEKRRISEWATTGLYYFRRGEDFVAHSEAMIAADERQNGEFYVAPVYNRLIAAGGEVRVDEAEEVWVLGTPEDLENFEANYEA